MKFFDDQIEKRILAYCVHSQKTLSQVLQANVKNHFYTPMHSNFLNYCFRLQKDHGLLMKEDVLDQILRLRNADENTIEEYKTLYAEIKAYNVDEQALPFYLDQLKDYSLKRKLYDVMEKGIVDLEKLDSTQTLDRMIQSLSPLRQLSENIPLVERFAYETIDQRREQYLYKKEHPDKAQGLTFGFSQLDNITNGVYQKELAMFFGRTGAGKSRVLNNVAYNLAEKGIPGILFSLEMYIDQLERIFDSRGAKLSYTKLKKGQLDQTEEERYFNFLEKMKSNKPPLYLVDYSANCSPSFIQSIIRERKQIEDIKWICIDYLTLMEPDTKWTSETAKYGALARELKQIAKAENIVIITASQSNRQSIGARRIGTQHVSFSDEITHNCDLIVNLRQDEKQEEQHIMEMNVVKYRDGESKTRIEMFCDWDVNYLGDVNIVQKGAKPECQQKTPPTAQGAVPLPPTETEKLL